MSLCQRGAMADPTPDWREEEIGGGEIKDYGDSMGEESCNNACEW